MKKGERVRQPCYRSLYVRCEPQAILYHDPLMLSSIRFAVYRHGHQVPLSSCLLSMVFCQSEVNITPTDKTLAFHSDYALIIEQQVRNHPGASARTHQYTTVPSHGLLLLKNIERASNETPTPTKMAIFFIMPPDSY